MSGYATYCFVGEGGLKEVPCLWLLGPKQEVGVAAADWTAAFSRAEALPYQLS